MTAIIRKVLGSKRALTLLAAATVGILPAVAGAADRNNNRDRGHEQPAYRYEQRDDRRDFDRDRGNFDRDDFDRGNFDRHDNDDRGRVGVAVTENRVWVEPVYRTITEQRWVAPVYRTVTDKVWHEPLVRQEIERVWIGDKYETRPVDPFGHTVALKKVLIKPGHYEERCHDIVVKPGYYEDVCRQELVCDGHYETVTREELVSAGHWETCDPRLAVNVRLPF